MSLASRAFRFGVNMLAVDSSASWEGRARHVEQLGFDVLLVPDHLGIPSPWPALATAAAATERLRVGPFVLNAAFTNPVLLARDVATVDQLSDGRVELGLGTGYVKEEFEAAGIEFPTAGRRVDHLGDTVARVTSLLSAPEHTPRPVQGRVPLLLGGNGDRVLRMAAEHADIVGFTAARTGRKGDLEPLSATDFDERVAFARDAAGARSGDVEWNLLMQIVVVTDDPRRIAEENIAKWELPMSPEEFLDLPSVLIGSAADIAARLVELRKRTGISYLTVLEPVLEQFAPVIGLLRDIDR
ncbi:MULTISPECIES: TIGR03621 family F420-dependent LLM class oxidoreductase [Gordonia]|uniref:N5,N10-methylene tetrahydromethanopterin reductase n=2 Tax=Gordonia alkanivorans TaxID=84096 RepID=W9DI35_9ACTN|nr:MULTISPECIES: TIGR03621 family F420-dependent LLM class oxidoreductase [Gordonia]ETA05950.1 N5,N10-methylene tetrahydromethanopterin reductase [Gordonia alkanivorans CGMCC 6845]MDH3009056.1 TIGR03621 family F420-dependent LLM class oxidoreductase [Gordonia alkanivorans]MDH3012917.1 TIGR03621 family F420-dependent LLM class oxidoreductase [Gordonia alkanivorans]MDH3018011.1 TIGR03621 family F420-dependent LLM class oxidoreductase [Gordonia alkanivorans]MDH3021912.1 TIGR03621 family F420-depe